MKSLITKWNLLREDLIHKTEMIPGDLLLERPSGFANNLLWQVGHITRTAEFLTLKFAGIPLSFPANLDPLFAKGSSPDSWISGSVKPNDLFEVEKKSRLHLNDILNSVDPDKAFAEPYTTSLGVVLGCIRDSFEYNFYHEGVHAGEIVLYKKILKIP